MKGLNIVENEYVRNSFYGTFEKGQHAGETYYIQIAVACNNPLCTCGELAFGLRPVNKSEIPPDGIPSAQGHPGDSFSFSEPGDDNKDACRTGPPGSNSHQQPFPIQFYLDVLREKAAKPSSNRNNPLVYDMAGDMAKEMTSPMWKQLRSFFYAGKSAITHDIEDFDTLKADFSLIQDDILNESILVAYNEILPYADTLFFTYEGKKHLAIDQYCVVPRCSCTRANIVFGYLADDSDKFTRTHVYSYNYVNRKWSVYDDSPPLQVSIDTSLVKAFEMEYPRFRDELKKRHRNLRRLFSNYLKSTNQPAETPASDEAPRKPIGKIGRNDPCPCGSGRKYKQCCGR
jgi:hypothetical protein